MAFRSDIDPNDIPVAINLRRNCEKKAQSLTGLCAGMMLDNSLSEEEIKGLYQFLLEFSDLSYEWPYSHLLSKVQSILEDGIVTEQERKDFEEVIRKFIGGTLQDTGAVTGLSTSLPIETGVPIVFQQKTFCFTGQSKYGTRSACRTAIEIRGGIVKDGIVKDLDYLVIGELATRDWIETNYGRKIQKAMDMKKDGQSKVAIIGESDWMLALESITKASL